jgi:tetratricopeptide (TPR) repeat protein
MRALRGPLLAGCLASLWFSPAALAQDAKSSAPLSKKAAAKKAKVLFEEGQRLYNIGEIDAALFKYKESYLTFSDPILLFNIAQCQRQLEQHEDAIRAYKVFLREAPETPYRAEVEQIVASLEEILRQKAEAERVTPAINPPLSRASEPAEPEKPKTLARRLLLPGVFAGVGAACGAGSLLLNAEIQAQNQISQARARLGLGLAVASDASFALAVGLAAWTLLRPAPDKERASLAPSFAPGQALATFTLSFP